MLIETFHAALTAESFSAMFGIHTSLSLLNQLKHLLRLRSTVVKKNNNKNQTKHENCYTPTKIISS